MSTIPQITVQLVHIQGPLKGDIQELSASEIRIGRHPDCQVKFPKDLTTLSRVHAKIVREGNRFKIIDQSTNGTYVNGQRIAESYLKDGDVVMFAEGGPKASFLTQTATQPATAQPAQPETFTEAPIAPPSPPKAPAQMPPVAPIPSPPMASPAPSPLAPAAQPGPAIEQTKVPLAIQYGPALKSFQTLPIIIGSGPGCDFPIANPGLSDQHAQIFFAQDRYWVKDLTGMNKVTINSLPISGQAALESNVQLALSNQGPKFRFLGGGRLAEIEDPLPETPEPANPTEPSPARPDEKAMPLAKKAGSLFKKFFT
ncbi:MAG: FHA domain-containing protein [Desulfatitalea sp.]|nr:FHA domain-containing protein [Desulfatitalea sp.]NNK00455.1 FHA domain-containing protein [Desulfatitalea sp.]